jgi:four helix bundle protein
MATYRDLVAWKKGIQLVIAVYRATESFPRQELHGLTAQMRRAAVSFPANIAEGHGRFSTPDFIRFLNVARGSLLELETHIIVARELRFLQEHTASDLLRNTAELGKIINGLIESLSKRRAAVA